MPSKRRVKKWFDRPEPVPAVRDVSGEPQWTLDMVLVLGRVPDREIARRFVLTLDEIRAKRRERGVPTRAWCKREWTQQMLADLKVLPNKTFQYKYQIDWVTVVAKRKELQIPLPSRCAQFTPQMNALLGKRSDQKLARSFNLSIRQIALQRQKLGIPSYTKMHQRVLTPDELALLGQMKDRQVAQRLGVETKTVRGWRRRRGIPRLRIERWTPELIALLGKVMDSVIARRMGVSGSLVTVKRKSLGIARYSPRNRWAESEVRLFGKIPDGVLAAKLGVNIKTVVAERQRRNIPAFSRRRREVPNSPERPDTASSSLAGCAQETHDGTNAHLIEGQNSVVPASDTLAAQFGLPLETITQWRSLFEPVKPNPFITGRPKGKSKRPPGTLSAGDVASHYGISPTLLATWRSLGLPHERLGSMIVFHRSDLEHFMRKYAKSCHERTGEAI